MKNNKNVLNIKNGEGITLIALVVTIIVLIILAGVSINLLFGQYGVVTKAKDAKEKQEIAQVKEDIQLKLVGLQVEKIKKGESITTGELEEIINTSKGEVVKDANGTITGVKVGDTTIPIEEVTQGITIESETPTYTAYTRGQTVKIGTESFYVLHDSGTSEEKVTLLAAKNIDTTTMEQSDSAGTIAFSNTDYWLSETSYPVNLNNYESASITSTDAIEYAKAYGTAKGGTGRLITVEEAFEITGLTKSGTIISPDWIKTTTYWLGSAYDSNYVWNVEGANRSLGGSSFRDSVNHGVRPVIEISKSLIS